MIVDSVGAEYASSSCVDRLLGAELESKILESSELSRTFAKLYSLLQISKLIPSTSLDTHIMQALLIYASQ